MIAKIRTAKPGDIIWDKGEKNSVTGLHLKVNSSGKKVWMLYYRTRAGQQRRPKIGDFQQIGLVDARKRAVELLGKVTMGLDPKADWDQSKQELIVDELFDKCWQECWDKDQFQTSGWARQVQLNYKNHIKSKFGRMKLSAVGTVKVSDWHESMVETPIAANRSLEVLSRMFNYAIKKELRPQGSNPCNLVKAHSERRRKRYAGEEELRSIVRILEREFSRSPNETTFLYLLIYTGARPRAIERGLRSELKRGDFRGMVYGVLEAEGKSSYRTGDDEIIVFPPKALSILDQIPEPKDGTLCGCSMPYELWNKIRKEVGCNDLWARDFRRTFATVGMSYGVNSSVIGELQNHKTADTMRIYQKLMPNMRLDAAVTISNRIERIINERSVQETTPLQEGPSTK